MTEPFFIVDVENLHYLSQLMLLLLDRILAGERMSLPACRIDNKIRPPAASSLPEIPIDCREVPNLGYQHVAQPQRLCQEFSGNR